MDQENTMKNTFYIVLLALAFSAFSQAAKAEDASVQMGEKLFNDPALGGSTSSLSCSKCHPGGKGLDKAAELPNLASTINYCIENSLNGSRINENSVEMQSLILYIKSLQK